MMRQCEAESFWCQKDPSDHTNQGRKSQMHLTNQDISSALSVLYICLSMLVYPVILSFPIHTTTLISLFCSTSDRKSRKHRKKSDSTVEALRMKPLTLPAWNLCTRRMGCPGSVHHFILLPRLQVADTPSPPTQKLPCRGFPFLSG